MVEPRRDARHLSVLRIVFIYAIVGALWIYLSDTMLGLLIHDPEILTRIAVFKGLAFILLTASLLYFLISRYTRQLSASEEELSRQKALLNCVVEGTSDAVYVKSKTGCYLLANSATCADVEKPPAEILGRDDTDLFPPDEADKLMANDRWVMTQDGPRTFEEHLSVRGGQRTYLSTKGPVSDLRGNVVGLFGIARDITEIKKAQQELRESEEDLKLLMELMPVGVAWNNKAGRIEYANSNFVERFGYTLSEIPTVEDWFLRAYPDPVYRHSITGAWLEDIDNAQIHGVPVPPREVKITCKEGTVRDVIINTQLARNRTLVIFTDITEREKTQKEILKTQKLESLGLLAGGIAHDFNNVLTGILGNISFAQLLLDESHDATIPLQQAEQASLRAAELAHQLLTFAKGNKPNLKPVPARRLVEESVSLVLRGAKIKASLDIPDSLHTINVDEGQICQAFNNIIINSAQAMPGGGTIYIAAENQVITDRNTLSLPPGEYVRFTFRDEGCGIPEEDQKRIFDPYFTTKPGGTGIGLSSVHSIIGKHGGHIGVSSLVGKGTTFEIFLPSIGITIPEDAAAMTDIGADRHCGGAILVMDDEEMIRSMTTSLLEMLGYSVKSCATGEEAVSMYRSAREAGEPFSAVIMDLTVPGAMGGKEAAGKILEYDPQACLIVSSGYSNDPIMTDYESCGFRGAVAKPYKVSEIAQTLAELLSPRKK